MVLDTKRRGGKPPFLTLGHTDVQGLLTDQGTFCPRQRDGWDAPDGTTRDRDGTPVGYGVILEESGETLGHQGVGCRVQVPGPVDTGGEVVGVGTHKRHLTLQENRETLPLLPEGTSAGGGTSPECSRVSFGTSGTHFFRHLG